MYGKMVYVYQDLFKNQEEILKVLANQKRLEIIQLLLHRELSVSEIKTMLGMRQANLSQHLSALKSVGITKVKKRGRKSYYSLTDPSIGHAIGLVRDFLVSNGTLRPTSPASEAGQDYPIVADPVCGMRLSRREAAESYNYEGSAYYFCGRGCYKEFRTQPSLYVK